MVAGTARVRLDHAGLTTLLERLDTAMTEPGTLCLIGSGATILLGQHVRQTDDIHVWKQASTMHWPSFSAACAASGLTFDLQEDEPGVPHLQIIQPGVVYVPGWDAGRRTWFTEAERVVWQGAWLTVTVPPPHVIAASKLVRGDARDLEDCLWLMAAHDLDARAIQGAIKAMPRSARDTAEGNLDLLSFLKP